MKSFLAMVLPYLVPIVWGLSGYFGGIFSKKANDLFAGHFWIALGFLVWSVLILSATNFNAITHWQWSGTGFAFGLVYSLGALVFVLAIALSGFATKVVALSALYPAVTALILFIFHSEPLPLRKVVGIILAVIVGWLMV